MDKKSTILVHFRMTSTTPSDDTDPTQFSQPARTSLLRTYSIAEVSDLEQTLATPAAKLHVRFNRMRCSTREEALTLLAAHPNMDGFEVRPHEQLSDVLVIPRRPPHESLAPLLQLEALKIHGPERFAQRKSRGLPSHELFVDRMCAEAVLKGADIYITGVRGASHGVDAGHLCCVYADLHGVLLRGAACDQHGLHGMRLLGIGTCCVPRAALFREASGLACRMSHIVDGDLPSLAGVLDGIIYHQTLPSLTAAHVLGAGPGDKVLDMCGAPGSKTTHVASNFLWDAPGSLLVTCERNHGKLAKLARLCNEDFGLRCVRPLRADTTKMDTTAGPAASPTPNEAADAGEAAAVGANAGGDDLHHSVAADQDGHRGKGAVVGGSAEDQEGRSHVSKPDHPQRFAEIRAAKQRRKAEQRARERQRCAVEKQRLLAQADDSAAAATAAGEGAGPIDGSDRRAADDEDDEEGAPAVPATSSGVGGISGYAEGSFDKVLLDPPCSALGLRPKLLQAVTARGGSVCGSQAAYQRREPASRPFNPRPACERSLCFAQHQSLSRLLPSRQPPLLSVHLPCAWMPPSIFHFGRVPARSREDAQGGRHPGLLHVHSHARGERGAGGERPPPLLMPASRARAAEGRPRGAAWTGPGRWPKAHGAALRACRAGVRGVLLGQVCKGGGVRRRGRRDWVIQYPLA